MKKYAIAFVAVVLAIAGSSFISAKRVDCSSSNLVWYLVKAGAGSVSLNAFNQVDISKLDLTPYSNVGLPVVDANDFTGRQKTQDQEITATGCPATNTYICAVAFAVDTTPDGEFLNQDGFIIPKSTSNISNSPVICVVKRSILP